MGGIIVVDFIDMHNPNNRKTLFEKLKDEMKRDRAKHTILPPSKFGLIQITRQRVRPETNITTVEKCPSCDGTGEIKASVLLVDDIENNMRYFVSEQNEKYLSLVVHPYLESYLNNGSFFRKSIAEKWKKKYKIKLKVNPNNNYHMLEYHFFNQAEEEIKI
jgi:ribonuclease G